jgi:hypothetical protein
MDGALAALSDESKFTLVSGVIWSADIQLTAAPLNQLLRQWMFEWARDPVRRKFTNFVIADFVDQSNLLETFQEILMTSPPIGSASPPAPKPPEPPRPTDVAPNGRNVVEVRYGVDPSTGAFRRTTAGDWVETNINGVTFNFDEDRRDEWSAYLIDRSRGVEIQLDLYRKMVRLRASGHDWADLYRISSARGDAG